MSPSSMMRAVVEQDLESRSSLEPRLRSWMWRPGGPLHPSLPAPGASTFLIRLRPPYMTRGGLLKHNLGTSLVAQWQRICLPMQGTQVRSLVQEDSTFCGQLNPMARTTEPMCLKPVLCNRRHHSEKPAHCKLKKAYAKQWRPSKTENKQTKKQKNPELLQVLKIRCDLS